MLDSALDFVSTVKIDCPNNHISAPDEIPSDSGCAFVCKVYSPNKSFFGRDAVN